LYENGFTRFLGFGISKNPSYLATSSADFISSIKGITPLGNDDKCLGLPFSSFIGLDIVIILNLQGTFISPAARASLSLPLERISVIVLINSGLAPLNSSSTTNFLCCLGIAPIVFIQFPSTLLLPPISPTVVDVFKDRKCPKLYNSVSLLVVSDLPT